MIYTIVLLAYELFIIYLFPRLLGFLIAFIFNIFNKKK